MENVPEQEVECRIRNFQLSLQETDLDGAFILQNVDLFYFSGTIQSSILFIPQQGELCIRLGQAGLGISLKLYLIIQFPSQTSAA